MSDDRRLYLTDVGWEPAANRVQYRLYCHHQSKGDDAYHRIAIGEIYLRKDTDVLCLTCARDREIITDVRPKLPAD